MNNIGISFDPIEETEEDISEKKEEALEETIYARPRPYFLPQKDKPINNNLTTIGPRRGR